MNNLTGEERETLLGSNNEAEWNATCDKIKAARDGQYPPDWYVEVIATGMLGMNF